jgi:multiple sugar transport system permease protein
MSATSTASGNRSRWTRPSTWVLLVIAVLATIAVLLPILIVVTTAFKPAGEVNAYPPTLLPHSQRSSSSCRSAGSS